MHMYASYMWKKKKLMKIICFNKKVYITKSLACDHDLMFL